MFGARDQVGPERVALDIPQDGGQMIIVLNRKCLVSPLPNVAGGVIMAMISLGVSHK